MVYIKSSCLLFFLSYLARLCIYLATYFFILIFCLLDFSFKGCVCVCFFFFFFFFVIVGLVGGRFHWSFKKWLATLGLLMILLLIKVVRNKIPCILIILNPYFLYICNVFFLFLCFRSVCM